MVNYAGTEYYYLRNGQNDVVKLIDNSGDTVVEYIYDSWGRVVTTSGTLATTLGADQPFCYRGYVYDAETGWYYLQSRYYSPETCRFISADVLLSTGQGVLGHNSFAYCLDNPVSSCDPLGLWTVSVSFTLSAVIAVGISFSIGFAFDDQGNFDLQYSYAIPFINETGVFGFVSAGVGVAAQYTNADTVFDLYGSAMYIGASAGAKLALGADAISFSEGLDADATIDGVQVMAGFGIGLDTHLAKTYTESLIRTNKCVNSSSSVIMGNRSICENMIY